MPDKVCVPGNCEVQINADSAVLLADPDSAAPTLQSHGETIAMTKTFQHLGRSIWNGQNAMGDEEVVEMDRDTMDFTYRIGLAEPKYLALGSCEER